MYSLTALQLLAVTKSEHLKHERSYTIFNDLIENLKSLNNEGKIIYQLIYYDNCPCKHIKMMNEQYYTLNGHL